MEPIKVTIDESSSVLSVCICGKHKNDSVPIEQLKDANVLIHYVDSDDDIIKRWEPQVDKDGRLITTPTPERKQIEEQFKNAFKEFLMSGHLVGLQFAHEISEKIWDDTFNEKYLKFRLDKLYGKKKRVSNPRGYDNCIFVKIPRTGTASINQIIRQYLGHITALEWIAKVGRRHWDSVFTFAVVRNPYDKFVSGYYHSELNRYKDINDYLREDGIESALAKNYQVFCPQHRYTHDTEGNQLVKNIYKFEDLNLAWMEISSIIGTDEKLPHIHKTKNKTMKLNKASKEILYKFYRKDFEVFGYER